MSFFLKSLRLPIEYDYEVHDRNSLENGKIILYGKYYGERFYYSESALIEKRRNRHDNAILSIVEEGNDRGNEEYFAKLRNVKYLHNTNEVLDVLLFYQNIPVELREIIFQYFHLDYQECFIIPMMMQVMASRWYRKPLFHSKIHIFRFTVKPNQERSWRPCTDASEFYYRVYRFQGRLLAKRWIN